MRKIKLALRLSQFIRNLPLRHKVTLLLIVISGLVLIFASVMFLIFDRFEFKKQMIRDIQIQAEMIGSNCTASLLFNIPNDAFEILNGLRVHPNILSGTLFDSLGKTFAQYRRADLDTSFLPTDFPSRTDIQQPESRENDQARSSPSKTGNEFAQLKNDRLWVSHAIILDHELIGTVLIETDLVALKSRSKRTIKTMALIIGATFLIIFFLILRFQSLIIKPIIDLTETARAVTARRDYSVRAPEHHNDEIGFLITRFNEMLSQIEQRDRALQDASSKLENQASALKSELTIRHQVEAEIKKNLKEKDILLQEIHHRVKNNLQIISSLLKLQVCDITDETTVALFDDCRSRVHTMALIHDQLYRSRDFSNINFQEYIENLTKHLFRIYKKRTNNVEMDVRVDDVKLALDTAIPCGLLINELVSNSLKYAFPDGRSGLVQVHLKKLHPEEGAPPSQNANNYILKISDNGIGLPEHIDVETIDSLGLKLVQALSKQIRGVVDTRRQQGTTFTIHFKEYPGSNT